jgi:hypothetical protein
LAINQDNVSKCDEMFYLYTVVLVSKCGEMFYLYTVVLVRKRKDWLAINQDNVNISPHLDTKTTHLTTLGHIILIYSQQVFPLSH